MKEPEITNRPTFLKTKETIAATNLLRQAGIGSVVTWDQLSRSMGTKAQGRQHSIESARRELAKEGILFASVRGIGYKRLDDSGIVGNETDTQKRIGRSAKRSLHRLSFVKPENLDAGERTEYAVASAVAGAVAACTGLKQRHLIEQAVIANNYGQLAIDHTIRLLGGKA